MRHHVAKYRHFCSSSIIEATRSRITATSLAILFTVFYVFTGWCQAPQFPPGGNNTVLVGKVEDCFEVTPSGQVSYEIPIKVPTGTGGMEPKMSISYNGSKRTGLCGVGFDLTGLSVINRAPANLHVDGRAGVVEIDANDCLMLDGQRLILVADLGNGRKEWRTEQDSYSRIISQEGDALGPYSFTVQTKSGLTYYYDSDDSPRADRNNPDGTSQIHFLFWLLKRVEDTSGNYFSVTYGTDNLGGEYWPVRIDYTGNDAQGLLPYASLRFEYTITPDSTVTYIGGLRIRNCHQLARIKAYCGNEMARRYDLVYQTINGNRQLTSVTEHGPDGSKYPSTAIEWGNATNYSHINAFYEEDVKQSHIIIGDFNGDGISDFCTLPKNSNALWDGWQLYCGSSSGQVSYESRGGLQVAGDVNMAVSGDFNGDGLDDLVLKRTTQNGYKNCDLYLADTIGGLCSLHFYKCIIVAQNDNYDIKPIIRKAENGTDLFVFFRNSKNAYFLNAHPTMPLEVSYYPPQLQQKNWWLVRVGDFNGDGLTDIMNTNGLSDFLLSDGLGQYVYAPYTINKLNPSGNYEGHLVGDFNGEGKSDILVYTKEYNYNEQKYYRFFTIHESTGNGFKYFYPGISKPGDCSLSLADVNGDGCDDMVTINNTSNSGSSNAAFHLNSGCGKQFVEHDYGAGYALDKWSFALGDFNGDGRTDLLCTSNGTGSDWRGYWVYRSRTEPDNQVVSITDGLGNTTSVEYGQMTNPSIHTSEHTDSGFVRSLSAAWPLVSRVTVPDGIGGTRSTTYRYHNALLHKRGRGAMGFEQTTVRDEATGTETVTHYKVNPDEFVMTPDHRTVTVNGRVIEESEMTDTLVYRSSHVFSILPKETTTWSYEYNTGELVGQAITRQEHDRYGNVTRLVTETPYKTVTNVNTYADDTTFTGTSSHWKLGRLVSAMVTKCGDSDTLTLHSTFEYDASTGLLTGEAIEPGDNQLGSRKTYTRDGFGNIVQSVHRTYATYSQQRVTKTVYDDKGRFITAVVNASGDTVRTVQDPLLCVPVMTVGANNDTTTYRYDGLGNLLRQATAIDTLTVTTSFDPDTPPGTERRYLMSEQRTGQPDKVTCHDALGRAIWSRTDNIIGQNHRRYSRVEYDSLGRIARASDPFLEGQTIRWNENEYDAVGRVIRQTDPAGNYTTFAYSGLTTVTTDPLGRSSTKTIDMEGNLVLSEDAMEGTVEYEYDLDGHCITVTGPRTTIVTEYDRMGRRTRLVDPDLGETTYRYNGFGELTGQTSNGKVTSYIYDLLGRVEWEEMDDYTIIHYYDSQWKGSEDQATTFMGGTGRVQYTYDTHGRVITKTEYITNKTFVTRFTYNALNQVEQITYPNGLKVRNTYSNGYLYEVRNADTDSLYWRAGLIDARGRLGSFTYGNGLTTEMMYNNVTGRIDRINIEGVLDNIYVFDAVGNLVTHADGRRDIYETFSYDDLDRLVEVSRGGSTVVQQMTYDAAGNITSKTGVGTQIGYVEGTNRVSYIRGGDYTPVQWNELRYTSFNKVKYVAFGDNTLQLTYGWDKQRKLAVSTMDTIVTRRYYAGKYFEQEERGDTIRQTCYLYGPEGLFAMVIRMDGTDSVRYSHKDHLGSVIAYSNELGNLVQELSYDAWGRRRDPATWDYLPSLAAALALDPRGFTGHEHLDLLEMVNMDGRMYDPVLGRFLSPDPLVQDPDFTQSLNRYAYCLNNPLSLCDPTGYSWFSDNWKTIVASAVGIAVGISTSGIGSGISVAIIAGAAGGAAGAMVGSILNGQNFGQIVKSTLQGALFGAMSGALNYACGDISNIVARLAAHAVSDGFMEGVQGGNFLHGAAVGLLSAGSGEGMMALGGSLKTGARLAIQVVVGGTISELGGGNFANGAITAAFSFMFNHLKHYQNMFHNVVEGQIPNDKYASQTGLYESKITVQGFMDDETGELSISVYSAGGSKAALVDETRVQVKASLVLDGQIKQVIYCKSVKNDGNYYFAENGLEQLAKGSFRSINYNSYRSIKVVVETRWSAVMLGNHQYTPTYPGTIGFRPISAKNVVTFK